MSRGRFPSHEYRGIRNVTTGSARRREGFKLFASLRQIEKVNRRRPRTATPIVVTSSVRAERLVEQVFELLDQGLPDTEIVSRLRTQAGKGSKDLDTAEKLLRQGGLVFEDRSANHAWRLLKHAGGDLVEEPTAGSEAKFSAIDNFRDASEAEQFGYLTSRVAALANLETEIRTGDPRSVSVSHIVQAAARLVGPRSNEVDFVLRSQTALDTAEGYLLMAAGFLPSPDD